MSELEQLRAELEQTKAKIENGAIGWSIVAHYRKHVARITGMGGDGCDREWQLLEWAEKITKERDELAAKCVAARTS